MPKPHIPKRLRDEVAERAKHCCEYCQIPKSHVPVPFDVEHIVPLNIGGTNNADNLAYSCHGCNLYKMHLIEAFDSETGQSVPLFHPRKDEWKLHFAWDENFEKILAQSPTGRATVEQLRLNRVALLNLRRVMVAADKLPPEN